MYVNIFKHLLLRNHWVNQSQISYRASMGWGNESLFNWSRSHDQDCRHAIYGENIKTSSFLEPKGRWLWTVVCCISCSSTTRFVQMMTLDSPWPISRQGQIWFPMLLYGEKGKTMDFSEKKYCSLWCQSCLLQLTKWLINLYEYQGHSLILVQGHSDSTFSNLFFLKTAFS